MVDVVGLRLEDQIQGDAVAHLGRLPLDLREDPRRPEVLESVGHHAEDVAATLNEASGEHIRGVAGLPDYVLDTLQRLRGDVRAVVQDARNSLDRDARSRGHISNCQALPLGHFLILPIHRKRALDGILRATSCIDCRLTPVLACYRSRERSRQR